MGNCHQCCEGATSVKVQHLSASNVSTLSPAFPPPHSTERDNVDPPLVASKGFSSPPPETKEVYYERYAAASSQAATKKAAEWVDDGEDDWVDDLPSSCRVSSGKLAKRRPALSAEAYGSWNKPTHHEPELFPKDDDQERQIRKGLRGSPFFAAMPEEDLKIAINASRPRSFEKDDEVTTEGDENGDEFYILSEGSVHAYKKLGSQPHPGQKLVTFNQPGQSFGELALLHNCPRAATIIAAEPCILYSLDRDTFKMVLRDNAIARRERNMGFLRSVKLLDPLDTIEIGQIADALKEEQFNRGEFIVRVGEMGDSFYIVEEGEAVARINGMDARSYTRGGYFGELSLINDRPRAADIVASSDELKVVSLDRDSFKRVLGENALFKQLEDSQQPATTNGSKKKGVGFANSDAGAEKESTARRGTGYIQKGQLNKLLAENGNDEDEDDDARGVRFSADAGSDDDKPSGGGHARRGTGYIQANQMKKLLQDMEDDEELDELGGGPGVRFDVEAGAGEKTGTARRGTGYIQKDQMKKLIAEDDSDDGRTGVGFAEDTGGNNGKSTAKRGTGYISKAQMDKLLDEDDPEDSVTASDNGEKNQQQVDNQQKGAKNGEKKKCCTIM